MKYQNNYSFHRCSIRLKRHNYAWSAWYFVTMNASVPDPLFAHSELHKILDENWRALPQRFPSLTCDEFVIMPDHVHFVIHLEGNVERPVTLGAVVGAYKSLTTVAWLRYIKSLGPDGMQYPGIIWQRNYLERIIHSKQELTAANKYTINNPIKAAKSQNSNITRKK